MVVIVKESTLVLFMLTKYYKVFTEVVKKIMNTIGCHKGRADRERTLKPVEYVEHILQFCLTCFFPSSSLQTQTHFREHTV